jgi:hypothetical protein
METQDALDFCFKVLEQANPDIILTSFNSEDGFIEVLREHGMYQFE